MKHLILLLALATASPSWATLSCSAFLKDSSQSSLIARLTFDTRGKKHSMSISKDDILMPLAFTTKFLTNLTSHFSGKSTTASRLEERAVMREEDSQKLLDESGLQWVARDPKNPEDDFTTITSYSDKFILDAPGEIEVSVKMRSRKYYGHKVGESDTSKMASIFGDIGALELKVKNVAGVSKDGFKIFPDSIFKPRVFIADKTKNKLARLSLDKLKDPEVKSALVTEILETKFNEELLNKNSEKVEEFIDAVILLLEKNPDLFQSQIVVAYNRDSYSTELPDGTDYQYTLDRNIRIFEPNNRLKAGNTIEYLNQQPLHTVEPGLAFAELKSPIHEKTDNTPTYQKLAYALFSRHLDTYKNGDVFKEGKGKYSFGVRVRENIEKTTLSEQLYTEGLYYYLIKGVGNLPTPPHDKRLVQRGEWSIALPVKINNETHRFIIEYRALSNPDTGVRSQIIHSVKLINSIGREISINSDAIVNAALERNGISKITIDNQTLSFPSIVGFETIERFNDFFDRFYKDHDKGRANPREIESLFAVNNSSQLAAYEVNMKWENRMSWWRERRPKLLSSMAGNAFTGIIGGITLAVISYSGLSEKITTFFDNTGKSEIVSLQVLSDGEMLQIQGSKGDFETFNVSPVEPVGPIKPDLVIDLDNLEAPQ